MPTTTFNIDEFAFSGNPATAVQLSGPPILVSIDLITVFRNTVEQTTGDLPYRSRFASIVAAPSQFDPLVDALESGSSVSCTSPT